MIGIAIPAHNEESHIEAAVAAALRATRHPGLADEPCRVVVAADACSDATEARARAAGAWTVTLSTRNVGLARAEAARALVQAGARWLAFSVAVARVSDARLVKLLSLGADAVCGCVGVDDWSCRGDDAATVRAHFLGTYEDRDGHRHIHGANLGVSVPAYLR